MKVYVFEGPNNVYGFTRDPNGTNLRPRKAPWKPFKSLDMNPGEGARIGVNTDEVLMAIADRGYYETAAEIKWEAMG